MLLSKIVHKLMSVHFWIRKATLSHRKAMNTSNTRQTIAAYDKSAHNYAEKFDNYTTYQNRMREFQRKHIPTGAHILDLGCGPGNNIRTILEQDHTCIFDGIDLSVEFINIAKKRFPQFNFHLQNICNLNLRSIYDVVIASFCIVHLTDDETTYFIQSLSKIIRDRGSLYLSYMNGEKSGFETTSFSKDEIFFNYYQDEFILSQLDQAGFSILEVFKEEYAESDGSTTIDTFIYAMNGSNTNVSSLGTR